MSDEREPKISGSDWQRDAVLDPALRFTAPLAPTDGARRVLLTGATGMLGAHLLDELLRTTAAEFVCLVRAPGPAAAGARLRAQLDALALPAPGLDARVRVVAGDLGGPELGLDPEVYEELAAEVDAIIHAGAAINFLRPYSALRAVNVGGTEAVLRLAAGHRRKPVHYLSSLAVFFGQLQDPLAVIDETDEPSPTGLRSGYAQSKWVAERLVLAAGARGLPATIIRTARISGHSRTGATSSWPDLINRMIKACVLLGAYPRLDIEIGMIPVDFVTRATVHIIRQPAALGRSFHLFNPQPLPWLGLIEQLIACGYALIELEYSQWRDRLKQAAVAADRPERDSLAGLWMTLASNRSLLVPRPRYLSSNFTQVCGDSGIACPPIGAKLVARYVDFFVRTGYLPAPTSS
jgi:thioester reductase-like protein